MKRKCVLGVLKTEEGLRIKEEMLAWLEPVYEVFIVEQEAPGELFEYPAIRLAASISAECYESVLYIHTKGAGNHNNLQQLVRNFWKNEFTVNADKYFAICDENKDTPVVAAPIVGKNAKVCWYNGFVLSPGAARQLNKVISIKKDRMWFEQEMWSSCFDVKVKGVLRDDAECPEMAHDAFISTIFKRVSLMTIAKNENNYIREWLTYHHKIGIDSFFIIDNNDENDNSLVNTIADLIAPYNITVFDCRGNDALTKIGKQKGAYNYVLQTILRARMQVDWLGVIDVDEFVHVKTNNIKEFLYQDIFKDTDVIHLNWRLYDDNDKIHYENLPVRTRFTRQAPLDVVYNDTLPWTENCYVKSFIKIRFRQTYIDTHTTYIDNCVCRRSDGSLSDYRLDHETLLVDDNYIEHYNCKSLEEYIDRRCLATTDVAHATPVNADLRIKWYFNENEKTQEKLKYINERLNTNVD